MSVTARQIRLLIPYHGAWPVYFPLYLASLKRNPILDVVFFTDLPLPSDAPPNCSKVEMSLSEVLRRARERIDSDARIDKPYKLCDFKPAYGELFSDYLTGFSHWACGDIDLIYGDLAAALPKGWRDYDILSFRREWTSGCFAVFRNTPEVNGLYRKSSSFPDCLRDPRHLGFDECFGQYARLMHGAADDILSVDRRQSFGWIVRAHVASLRVYQETVIAEIIRPGVRLDVTERGIRDAQGREYLLYHFIDEKKSPYFAFPGWREVPAAYAIDRFGFMTEQEARSPLRVLRRTHRFAVGTAKQIIRRGAAYAKRKLSSSGPHRNSVTESLAS